MENPRIDFEEEMHDQCAHSYQDGFNSGYKQGQIDTIKRFCNITPPKTNADRIRSMTDEKLAELLCGYQCNTCDFNGFCDETDKCEEEISKWLKQENETN